MLTAWRDILITASERVQAVADRTFAGAERASVVGTGAAGDATLLADKASEDELISVLSQVGDLKILSEERGDVGAASARNLAILDPIDGSSNFARGIPFYCTSVCVVEGERLSDWKHALVRNLSNGDVYYAEKGKGASKNGKTIHSSRVAAPSEAVAGVDLSRAPAGQVEKLAPLLASLKRQAHFGANALELCLVAEGKLDAFVDVRGRMRITDFAAAGPIAEEAGAIVTSPDGGPLDPPLSLSSRFDFLAAGNRELHSELLRRLSGVTRGKP